MTTNQIQLLLSTIILIGSTFSTSNLFAKTQRSIFSKTASGLHETRENTKEDLQKIKDDLLREQQNFSNYLREREQAARKAIGQLENRKIDLERLLSNASGDLRHNLNAELDAVKTEEQATLYTLEETRRQGAQDIQSRIKAVREEIPQQISDIRSNMQDDFKILYVKSPNGEISGIALRSEEKDRILYLRIDPLSLQELESNDKLRKKFIQASDKTAEELYLQIRDLLRKRISEEGIDAVAAADDFLAQTLETLRKWGDIEDLHQQVEDSAEEAVIDESDFNQAATNTRNAHQ